MMASVVPTFSCWCMLFWLLWFSCSVPTLIVVQGALETTINTDALQSLAQNVRSTVLPNLLQYLNDTLDLSISAQVGSCCSQAGGDVGAKVSIGLSNLRFTPNSYRLRMDPLITNSMEQAQIQFNTTNAQIATSIAAQFVIAYGIGDVRCNPVVVAAVTMPQFSFRVNMSRRKSSTSSIGASFFQIALGNVQIQPLDIQFTVQEDSIPSSQRLLCNKNVLRLLTNVANVASDLLSNLATEQFRTEIPKFFNSLLDSVPVAFEAPVSILNGQLNVGLGLQALQSTKTGLRSVIGTSFSSTLLQPEWRNGYTYQRALVDDTTSSNNNEIDDRLVHMKFTFPPINDFIAAMWHQTWADLATDPTVMDHAEDFCTTIIDTTTTTTDPCPFPPIRTDPFTLVDRLILSIGFFFNTGFKYQAVIEPPVMDVVIVTPPTNTATTTASSSSSTAILQGRVPSKVALRGRSWFGAGAERTLASIAADVVIEMDVPGYDIVTGIIQFDGFQIRIENPVSETRLRLTELFIQAATSFLNRFIARSLLPPLNAAIQLGLNEIPLRLPKIENLPLRNYSIQFAFPNLMMNFTNALEIGTDLDININVPTPSRESSSRSPNVSSTISMNDMMIVGAAPEVNVSNILPTASSSVMIYSSFYDSGYSDVQTSRTTASGQVENYVDGQWVAV
jgi:hypothetical protein